MRTTISPKQKLPLENRNFHWNLNINKNVDVVYLGCLISTTPRNERRQKDKNLWFESDAFYM
jgi:hypothetical protein